MRLIEARLKEPEPTEASAPNWSEVLRLARGQFEALRKIDGLVSEQVAKAQAMGVGVDDMLVEVPELPFDPDRAVYRAVMTALYGERFWPWHDERAMEIMT